MQNHPMFYDLKHNIIIICCLFIAIASSEGCTVIKVKSQKDFDELREKLTSTIKTGEKNISITLSPGNYAFNENHITLKGINAPKTKIHIHGKGAILIPQGHEYHDGEDYQGGFSVNNSWMSGARDVETWSSVRYADSLIEILDVEEKRCRLKAKEVLSTNTDYSNAYILIPHWYQSSVYKIDKIDGKYIYFTANNLKESSYGGYNVNDDYNYGGKAIRYKLCNVETGEDVFRIIGGKVHLPSGVTSVWEGKTHNFITIQNCKFSSVELKGIQFIGNAFVNTNSAIYIKNSTCKEIKIHNCGFYGMRGSVVSVLASPNVTINHNYFEDGYYYGIWSNNESVNTVVEKNSFKSMGKRMNNTFCVECQGTNYHVSDNDFLNFGYGGIRTGVWYKNKMKQPCKGVIENNNLRYSQDYIDHIDNYGIMDGGAVYLTTKNAGSIVRYNHIHDFSGMKDNRGIFCDDGAYNIEIYGNVITGIDNSWCIDSRRVAKAELANTPESKIERTNVNISIHDNIVDGGIRFEANEGLDNGCVKGVNYILCARNDELPKMKVNHVTNTEDDIVLEYTGVKNGKISLTAQSCRQLKRNKNWRVVRNCFVWMTNFATKKY